MPVLDTLRTTSLSSDDASPTSASSLFSAQHAPSTPGTSPPTSAHPSAKNGALGRAGAAGADPVAHALSPLPDIDARAIACAWLNCLGAALSTRAEPRLRALFASVAVLRDSLVFSWDLRAPAGPRAIAAHLCRQDGGSQGAVRDIALDERPGLEPAVMEVDQPGAVSLAFTFGTPLGRGRGSARLFPRAHYSAYDEDNTADEWIADSAYTMLDALEGHNEARLAGRPDPGLGHEVPWAVSEAARRKKIEEEPYVVVVGAGQTGLMLAARFQQLGLRTLVIEKDARVGDEWRRRYRTLALHTPKEQHTLLFSPYPETWPAFTAKDKLADWLEAYATMHDLVLWTSAPLLAEPRPAYSEADQMWTVHVGQPGGGVRTVRCRHIVLATGALGPPLSPAVRGANTFRGEIVHASTFSSGADYAGRRVLVVGGANTAADVCEDLTRGGAARATMLQRSPTCTVLPSALAAHFAHTFPPGADVALCDFRVAGVPYRVRERLILAERAARRARGEDPDVEPGDAERMRKLQDAGFLVDHGPGGRGLLFVILERFGGHLVDVGFSDLLIRGEIDLVTGTELSHYTETHAHFTDGRSVEVDAVIYATGYAPGTVAWAALFGDDVIARAGPVWGLDAEGELRGVYRPSGHPALWYAGGDFGITRWVSKQLGLLLLARKLGHAPEPGST